MAATITLFNTDNTTGEKTALGRLGLDPDDAAVFSRWLSTRRGFHGVSEISYPEMHRMLYSHQACSYAASELAVYIRQWQINAIHALSNGNHSEQNCVSDYHPGHKPAKSKTFMFEVSGLPDS
ncbi:MAG: hypothetical protein WCL27_09955 [Betaproteobacteria bacterium]